MGRAGVESVAFLAFGLIAYISGRFMGGRGGGSIDPADQAVRLARCDEK